ncbi:MAG: tetratricopeptide repeat protein [Verrucomicrobiaceae bacterium]
MSTTPSTLALHQLSLYNTGRMSPEQVILAFQARLDVLQRILADLGAEKPKSRAQHHILVGQRGMGKTMLLARIAAELRTNAELDAKFIPLVFAEEQYAVDRLSKFWLNCLDSLADARELEKETAAVAEIDAEVERLTQATVRPVKDDQSFADDVYAAFAKAAAKTGQRPVLLVDNLQLVFERLEPPQQHALRELLMRPGSPILIGASPSPPPQSQDYGAAFYDHFKVHYLRPLEENEMRDLLVHLADKSDRPDVRQRVLQHPQRLKVLRQLTGGNPRTTLTLFFLYAEDFAPSVFGDLEGLLDRVTPLYKARFEELTAQQQVITSAIANHWDPCTAAILVQETALPAGTISAQLDRLEKDGTIERVELSGISSQGYQIAERFFNIWFLMRSASRRKRREAEFLTRFLESFYEPPDRTRLARRMLDEDCFSPDRYLLSRAAAAATRNHDPETAEELERHTELTALREQARAARARLHELIDFDSLPSATLAFDDLRRKLESLVPTGAEISPEDFAKAVLGDRSMFISGEREQLAVRAGKLKPKELKTLLDTIAASHAADVRNYDEAAVAWFSKRLATGQIRSRLDVEDWNRAFHQAEGRKCIQLMVDALPDGFGTQLTESSFEHIRTAIQPKPKAPAWRWFNWGYDLHYQLSRYAESENAYRKAIALDPKHARSWPNLGSLLHYRLQRYAEAESAYREAIALDPKNAWSWNKLGSLLQNHFQRYAEAESAYREAIALDPKNASHWFGLGYLLQVHLQRNAEAENAYREAIAHNPRDVSSRNNLGNLLKNDLQRLDEAASAYREAIARDPKYVAPLNGLGNLYCDFLDRPEDARVAFDTALGLDPSDEAAHTNRLFLLRDFLGEGASVRTLMTELLALPSREFPDTTHLHEALFAAYDTNWGLACDALTQAIAIRTKGFSSTNTDDWLRASAVLIHLNYGAELLAFLDQLGDTTIRLRPWVEALRALQKGDRTLLQNIAPEVRTTAKVFYDGIEKRLLKLPEKTRRRLLPQAKAKKTRRK